MITISPRGSSLENIIHQNQMDKKRNFRRLEVIGKIPDITGYSDLSAFSAISKFQRRRIIFLTCRKKHAKFIATAMAVDFAGKLATTWGALKTGKPEGRKKDSSSGCNRTRKEVKNEKSHTDNFNNFIMYSRIL